MSLPKDKYVPKILYVPKIPTSTEKTETKINENSWKSFYRSTTFFNSIGIKSIVIYAISFSFCLNRIVRDVCKLSTDAGLFLSLTRCAGGTGITCFPLLVFLFFCDFGGFVGIFWLFRGSCVFGSCLLSRFFTISL